MVIIQNEIIVEWSIINSWSAQIIVIFIFDYMSLSFIRLVRIISGRVFLFRVSYMRVEKYHSRFLILVILFILSIFLLILRPNLIRLLLGWDGLGVTSYLLVIFYQRNKSWNARILTALTNRIGDVGILVGLSLILSNGHWNYLPMSYSNGLDSILLILIIIVSACTKRAQMPFSAWLPAAMAAPTPVSSLVHSSTLVTAGVYLLIRFNNIFKECVYLNILFIISVITILMAGIRAIFEDDIKKIVALSTLRQLGVIIIILGFHKPILAYYHLILHAYFKAILFMCAGCTIHLIKDYQDIRVIRLGSTRMPFVLGIILVCNLSLCGLPFMRGFYSKDIILECVLMGRVPTLIILLILLATILTLAYSIRLTLMLGRRKIKLERISLLASKDIFMFIGIILLYPFSIFGGCLVSWYICVDPRLVLFPWWLKIIIPLSLVVGGVLRWNIYIRVNLINLRWNKNFIKNIFFLPFTIRTLNSQKGLYFGKSVYLKSEIQWIELILFRNIYFRLKKFLRQTNSIFMSYYLRRIIILFLFMWILFL